MKKITLISLVSILVLGGLLAACGNQDSEANESTNNESASNEGLEEVTIRAANFFPKEHSFGQSLEKLAEEVNRLSDGKITIETFHNAELGGEREVTEQVYNGSLEMADTGNVGLGAYGANGILVMEQPFLFDSIEHMAEVADYVRPLLEKNIEDQGFKLIALRYAGPRITVAKDEMPTFEDFSGLKLRVPELDLYVKFAEALGAEPTILPLPDVYTGLQTGVVDAYEGEAASILDNSFYEQAKNVHLTNHIYYMHYVVMNKDFWDGLSKEAQDIITEAAKISEEFDVKNVVETNAKALEELKNLGVNIIEYDEEEMQKFRDSVENINRELAESQGPEGVEIFEKMQEVLQK